jgi:folate-binding protein YgfZ
MEGRDARDFLHRLTTVDVRNLEDGSLKPGFLLTPQGKVRAAFRLAQLAPDSFLIEIDGGEGGHRADELVAALDQLTFAEKYALEDLAKKNADWKNAWAFGAASGESIPAGKVFREGPLLLLRGEDAVFGAEWTSAWGPGPEIDAWLRARSAKILDEEAFEALRIEALFPRADREIVADANPLELGLRSGIADNKGCYPGQEVIEKILSLGSPAKRIALVRAEGPLSPGSKLFLDEERKSEAGIVTSAARSDRGTVALALLRKNALEEGRALHAEGAIRARVSRIASYE